MSRIQTIARWALRVVILLLTTFWLRASDSVWVAAVEVVGNPAADTEWSLCTQSRQRYRREELQECMRQDSLVLLRWAQEQGYWFAQVSVGWDSEGARVRYRIEPGEAVRIAALEVTVFPDTPAGITQRLQWYTAQAVGYVASRQQVEELLDGLLRIAAAAGYPEARADIAEVRLSGPWAELRAVLYRGEPARADTVLFQGVQRTRVGFLRRWVDLTHGQLLTEEVLSAARQRLEQLDWLEVLDTPRVVRSADGHCGVVFSVREHPTTRFDGLLGYAPTGGWSGMVHVRLENLFGTGRSAAVRWYRAATQLHEVALQYEEPLPPWALVRGSFHMGQSDTLYTETLWEAGFRWLGQLAQGWWLELTAGQRRVEPAGTAPVAASVSWYGGIISQLQRLSPRDNPVRGVFLRLFPSVRWHHLGQPTQTRRRCAVEGDVESFLPIRFPFVLRLHGHGRLVWGEGLQYAELYRLGGVQTLRGWRESQVASPKAGWGGVEGRWLLGQREHVGASYELGWIEGVGWYWGTGVQWQLQTAAGLLQLSLAWGRGDRPWQAKLGVRLLDVGL